jgi:hypothetical protein
VTCRDQNINQKKPNLLDSCVARLIFFKSTICLALAGKSKTFVLIKYTDLPAAVGPPRAKNPKIFRLVLPVGKAKAKAKTPTLNMAQTNTEHEHKYLAPHTAEGRCQDHT